MYIILSVSKLSKVDALEQKICDVTALIAALERATESGIITIIV